MEIAYIFQELQFIALLDPTHDLRMVNCLNLFGLRSSYFQQIEEDARKHEKSIMELKIAIRSFQAKDMMKLLKFQRSVESFLEGLTDETQVNILWDFSNKINH